MGKESHIEWTDATWNVARGCTKVDEDCKFCYMYRDSMGSTRYNPLQVIRTKTVFDMPLKLKEPSRIFTSSLTDFFHPDIDDYRNDAWKIIRKCPQHDFQILTKRPERILECLPPDWDDGYENVWLGTSCGSQQSADIRIPQLLEVPAFIKFLSLEPLHGPIDLFKFIPKPWEVDWIDWVIIGGESGNEIGKYRYRPCELKWIEDIADIRYSTEAKVFIKQLGTHLAKELKMKDRHGRNIEEFPEHLRIRDFPNIE